MWPLVGALQSSFPLGLYFCSSLIESWLCHELGVWMEFDDEKGKILYVEIGVGAMGKCQHMPTTVFY